MEVYITLDIVPFIIFVEILTDDAIWAYSVANFFGRQAIGVCARLRVDASVAYGFICTCSVETFKRGAIAARFTNCAITDCTRNKLIRVSCAHFALLKCWRFGTSDPIVAVTFTLTVSVNSLVAV